MLQPELSSQSAEEWKIAAMRYIELIILIPVFLAGCVTSEEFAGRQEALKGSPELRRQVIEDCIVKNHFPDTIKRELAFTMKVRNDDHLMRTFCTRLIAGMASGRLTYEDMNSTRDTLPPKVVRLLQQP